MNTPTYVLSLTAVAASVRVAVPAVLQGWRVWWRVCRSLRAQRYRERCPTLADWPEVEKWPIGPGTIAILKPKAPEVIWYEEKMRGYVPLPPRPIRTEPLEWEIEEQAWISKFTPRHESDGSL